MKHTRPINSDKVKLFFHFQDRRRSLVGNPEEELPLVPDILELGDNVMIFQDRPPEQVLQLLTSISIFILSLGKWKEFIVRPLQLDSLSPRGLYFTSDENTMLSLKRHLQLMVGNVFDKYETFR